MAEAAKSPSIVARIIAFFTSMKLTIWCLAFGMVLIFAGTWAQKTLTIDQALDAYFSTWFVWGSPFNQSLNIPFFPGGYLIGAVLLFNLLAAHIYRFQFGWRKSGILLTHLGVILLIVGGIFTKWMATESFMHIPEGESKRYAMDHKDLELAIIDRSDPAIDKVVAIAESALESREPIQVPALPFRVNVLAYYANSQITGAAARSMQPGVPIATMGFGTQRSATEIPRVTEENMRDLTVVWVELVGTGGPIGTWMTSIGFDGADPFTYEGKPYTIELRPRRTYKPYSISLIKFTHDVYPGTKIPFNFASRIRLVDPRRNEDREVFINMNHPLRYDGQTFYQSGYDSETSTVLQVVVNPSWLLPYISCALVGLGLLIQFGIHLTAFFKRRAASA